ncbi:lactate 2-monooxygenase [Lecanosticta acicola]|uniref:Lactate 2-monooxygenase n=1 Tax=Lecanosticta acicola TaxID=111012 RepID=A0AAI8YXW9_9PEZI|nr:lactate 2-monooxygenase [Lecanosticta acicola]
MVQLSEARQYNQPWDTPDPNAWGVYQRDIYSGLRKPIFSTKPAEWEHLARERVPAENFGYVFGSASGASTYAANRSAFDRYRLRPRMLVNATRRDMSVELFGRKYNSPILVAPVGVQNIMHQDAEEATARACRKLQIPMILSTAATRTIEQVAQTNGDSSPRWFQLYWPKPQEEAITVSLLHRAKANGYTVLVVTLDTFTLAWRPQDLDHAYLPFLWGEGCQIGFSDPVFNQRYQELLSEDSRSAGEKLSEAWDLLQRPGTPWGAARVLANAATMKKAKAWMDVMNSGTYREWQHLAILKKLWDGPIVLKGIQSVGDAHKAIEHGMDGIIVSNHGGRQCDGAIASLDALAEIGADEKVQQSGLTLLFDSGIRTGSDVLTALALGAKAVLVGRPYMYGLAIAGQAGVEHVLQCLLADTDNMLANAGKTSLGDLGRGDLQVLREARL